MQNIEYITGMFAYQIGMVEKRRFNAYMVFSWILQKNTLILDRLGLCY